MAVTPAKVNISIDIVEGASWEVSNSGVQRVTRVAKIWGLVPTGDDGVMSQALQILESNLSAENNGFPNNHPNITNMFRKSSTTKMLDTTACEITITYESPTIEEIPPPAGSNAVISGGASLEGITTMKDKNGNQITTTHDSRVQGGEIQVEIPRRELSFSRVEQHTAPGTVASNYIGYVSSDAWNGPIGEWLCTSVDFDLLDSELAIPSWNFTYTFRHKSGGHKPTVVYVDPETGKPPPNLVDGTGFKDIDWYPSTSFIALNF